MPLQNLSDADQAWVQKQALPSADSRAASANQPGVADNRPASERITWVDRFEDAANLLGGKGGPYAKQPSKIEASRVDGASLGRNGKVLKLDFEKQGQGGPYGNGGWCGYAISLGPGGKPFDASKHLKLVFWLRGQTGGENFKLGLADVQWARQGDSIKSEDIVHYVAGGKISTQWQKVQVPLEIFYLDHKTLASVSIAFETDCFPDGAGRGVVYVDDLGFE
jgi:hypothetical protein